MNTSLRYRIANVYKKDILSPREPGTSASCSSRGGGLKEVFSLPSGNTLNRHFSSKFQADSINCPMRGTPEEILNPIEPAWYKGQLRRHTC